MPVSCEQTHLIGRKVSLLFFHLAIANTPPNVKVYCDTHPPRARILPQRTKTLKNKASLKFSYWIYLLINKLEWLQVDVR